jgi:hypothetical protein
MNPNEDLRPMFVLGCPRSGTTLIGEFLLPSQWGNAVETHFITKYAQEALQSDLANPQVFKSIAAKIIRERPIMQWAIPWDLDNLYQTTEPKSYPELVNQICLARSRKLGFPRWADKTPTFSFHVPLLTKLFPNAKYIFIYRDGRDVANSLLERKWGPNNIWAAAEYWRSCCNALIESEKLIPENSLLSIRYETLLQDPEPILRRLLAFLEYQASDEEIEQMASQVRGNNSNKWKTTLSKKSIQIFERTAGEMLQKLGYESSTQLPPIHALKRKAYALHDSLTWAQHMFDQNVLDAIRIKYFGKQPFDE